MKLVFTEKQTSGQLQLVQNEEKFDRFFFTRDRAQKFLTIAWNRGPAQTVTIDEMEYLFPSQSILPLMVNQSFFFENPADIVAWQFNRDFYCIVNHDSEVGCVGFLFYGPVQAMFVSLTAEQQQKLELLRQVFVDEFGTPDQIQMDMLHMLLKRLIIIVTRLAKEQFIQHDELPPGKLAIIRQYNLLVENHYRQQHGVQFYAGHLNKSAKTLSNLFALFNDKAPLQVIQERILLEAKRLLYYTDNSAKEIAYKLGFEDAAHFSHFFKKRVLLSPIDFRKAKAGVLITS